MTNTSWQKVSNWYSKTVGESGHYFHQHLVLPNTLRLLNLSPEAKLLDIACGQGILERKIPKSASYLGLDVSRSLIEQAIKSNHSQNHKFQVHDVTKPFSQLANQLFTHSTIILALQNISEPKEVFQNISQVLQRYGVLVIVINHPSFRIPRQSSWEIDPKTKQQFRRVNRYLNPLKIPITLGTHTTWSFHRSLQDYSLFLNNAGFAIEIIEEWVSPKHSVGSMAKSENLARKEFPLFMAIKAFKR